MKQLYTSVIALVGIFAFGQEVEVRWQKDIKSASQDFLSQLTTTIDGQHLLSGSTIKSQETGIKNQDSKTLSSSNTQQSNNGYDYHIVKLNQQGQTVWEKYFGGNNHDF